MIHGAVREGSVRLEKRRTGPLSRTAFWFLEWTKIQYHRFVLFRVNSWIVAGFLVDQMWHLNFAQVQTPEEIEVARALFQEYAAWLEISLCFQNFEAELAGLPGDYRPPAGRLLLAFANEQLAGCIALRDLGAGACEMKRLYLRPEFRGRGWGRELVDKIIREGREIGYKRMCLDTLRPKMNKAISLYRSLGFKEISPYYSNPVPGATFMELVL